jgi:hypothetical protein
LQGKGVDCIDFEPYLINPLSDSKKPDPDYSRIKAKEFLDNIADPERKFDSIFLASVINSIPFPKDRMVVLSIVHALCSYSTVVYGTCRDISDFLYEYSGIRQANYFVFDSEPGVRLGDSLANPKIQKFYSRDEFAPLAKTFWSKYDTWPGGNVFYWRCKAPKRVSPNVLGQALDAEFELPFADGSKMGLSKYARKAFSNRLSIKIP